MQRPGALALRGTRPSMSSACCASTGVRHQGQVAGVEGGVGVHHAHDVAGRRQQPGVARGAEAALRDVHHARPVRRGDGGRGVGGAVVRDDGPGSRSASATAPQGSAPASLRHGSTTSISMATDSTSGAFLMGTKMADRALRRCDGLRWRSGLASRAGWLSGMRVLVTGAAGFIGSHIAETMREAGHEVRGLDSLTPAVHNGRPSHVPGDLVVGDVRDPAAVDEALAGVDAVCHQAAMVGLGVDLSDLPMYSDVNATGTAVLLEAMGRHGIGRLVFASSMVVYGEGAYDCASHGRVRPLPRDLADLAGGRSSRRCPVCGVFSGYGHGRRGSAAGPAQRLCCQQGGAGAPGGQLGAANRRCRGRAALPQRVRTADAAGHPLSGVAAIFRSCLENGVPPRVFEDGGQRRDFVHVRDVARANLRALIPAGDDRGRFALLQRGQRGAAHGGRDGIRAGGRVRRHRARGDRGVPSRRCQAHRRLPRQRRAGSGLPGADAVRFGHRRVRPGWLREPALARA